MSTASPLAFELAVFEPGYESDWSVRMLDRRFGFTAVWIEAGSGTLVEDDQPVAFAPGVLLLLAPGRFLSWRFEHPVRGLMVKFREDFLAPNGDAGVVARMQFLFNRAADSKLRLEGAERAEMERRFADLRRDAQAAEPGYEDQVHAHLILILGQARRLLAARRAGQAELPKPLAGRFRTALIQHFPQLGHAADYARVLRIPLRRLNDELHLQFGRSASELIREHCVAEAKRLLAHSGLTISEIGFKLGFQDPSYFVRFFRQRTGLTPGDYRAAVEAGDAAVLYSCRT